MNIILLKKAVCCTLMSLTLLSLFCACANTEDGDIVDVAVSDGAEEKLLYGAEFASLPETVLELEKNAENLVCGTTFTVGDTMSDDLLFTGNSSYVFRGLDELRGAVYFAAGQDAIAGIFPDGTCSVVAKNKGLYSEALSWDNLVSLAFGDNFLVGLKADSTVVACGDNSFGQCNVSDMRGITQIAAGGNQTAVLLCNGKVVLRGIYADEDHTSSWTDIKEIACGRDFTVGVKKDGSVVAFNNDEVTQWENVHNIKAYGADVCAFTQDKTIITTLDNKNITEETKAVDFSVGDSFISVLKKNGKVKTFGNNDDLACETGSWDLGLTLRDGMITGFADNTDIASAKEAVSYDLGAEVIFSAQKDGAEITEGLIGTGMYVRTIGGKNKGRVLIYGDVDGDGSITDRDSEHIISHTNGDVKLEGVYLQAADTLHHTNALITEESAEKIASYVNGDDYIKQYVNDPYRESFSKSYSINNDVVGYVAIEDTRIDYPILYGPGYYYHDRTIYDRYSEVGSIYSIHGEYKKHNIIIGHNARGSGRMFHDLHKIQDREEELLVFKNRVIAVSIYNEYSLWELYALYETGPYEPEATQVANINAMDGWSNTRIYQWIKSQLERSELDIGTDVNANDTLLTLYTCGDKYYSDPDTQSRLYLFFRRVG